MAQSLVDIDRPLDEATRALLSSPPEPPGMSGAAIALFCLAGLFALGGSADCSPTTAAAPTPPTRPAAPWARSSSPRSWRARPWPRTPSPGAGAARRSRVRGGADQGAVGAAPPRLARGVAVPALPGRVLPRGVAPPRLPGLAGDTRRAVPLWVVTTAERAFGTTAPPLPR
ncbi:hypothetical protein ACFQ0M_50100 [Kitasatospora aburaviensis]